ncbi:GntP family permease [uncultured Acidaminococcus sp.]|uniref:GntP family permease n=1 Tax=uncultured Acidaminococcus sp. TaxID=352152 RepID=UPI002592536F|nr:GntP family permease [uncultured Acidaminococcus sp.]
MALMIPFLIGLAIMLTLMIKTKIGPFMSMLLGALIIGVGCGLPAQKAIDTIATGFGGICKSIGIVIIFGAILGDYLDKSNATQRIASTLLKVTGKKKADIALSATGFLVSIPVFCDVALIMLAPLVKAVSKKSGLGLGSLATALALSLLTTNTFVAPTPAPLSIVSILGIDLGESILWGLIVSAVDCVAILAFCRLFIAPKPEGWFTKSAAAKMEEQVQELAEEKEQPNNLPMPSFIQSIIPILVPIVLILVNTTCKMVLPKGSSVLAVTGVLGDKNIALALGIISAILMLYRSIPREEVFASMTTALTSSGPVIFITAAGGALAKVIDLTGVGTVMANALSSMSLPIILIPFLICGFSKFVQGSSSVAVIVASTLTLPLMQNGLIDPIVAFLSICAGSGFGSHVNNSYFWVFANLFGYDTKTSLKTLCVGQHVMAFAGLLATVVISLFR